MREYELLYILRPELEEDVIEQMNEKIEGWIKETGAEITGFEEIGKRRLAYEIQKVREGYYADVKFKAEPLKIADLDRNLKYEDQVLRHLITRDDE